MVALGRSLRGEATRNSVLITVGKGNTVKSNKLVISLFVLFFGVAVAVFSSDSSADSKTNKRITFNKDIAPIFYKNCAECHRPNDIAPMSLVTYKEARPWARSIKQKVLNREMPPWSPDAKPGHFSNDVRLSQDAIDTIVAWVDQGAREGDRKDLPPAPELVNGGWVLGKPDVVLEMAQDYVVEPKAPDNYINFFIPTNFKEDKWIQAAEIQPGNRRVVHHVIAFIQSAQAAAARQGGGGRRQSNTLIDVDGTLRRVKMSAPVHDDTCSNPPVPQAGGRPRESAGDENEGALLAGYAPGKRPDTWPNGVAKRVPAGSVVMFQMHYSAFRGDLAKPEKDRTRIGLYFAKQPPEKMVITSAVANQLFKIPAGAENHEVVACQTVPRDLVLLNYMPHMHLRGKDMKYEIIYPDGKRETLLSVPKFSFNWQDTYYLTKPLNIPKGAKFIVTAHFDNSSKNKYNPDSKKDVRWGDPTYDEMMIGFMDIMIDNPFLKRDTAKAGGGQ